MAGAKVLRRVWHGVSLIVKEPRKGTDDMKEK